MNDKEDGEGEEKDVREKEMNDLKMISRKSKLVV